MVIIRVFPFQPPKNPIRFQELKSGFKNKKALKHGNLSVLCLWKQIRTGHDFCTERNSSVSRRESQGSRFSQTSWGITKMMMFHCETPSVVGWRAVSRLKCFNPWLDFHSWIYTDSCWVQEHNMVGSSLPQQNTAALAWCSPLIGRGCSLIGKDPWPWMTGKYLSLVSE